mmetsp:Transcript_21528/g.31845  ORF Transcript_21528/g.31845 Transcript_21528/m.31845 type:complete len:772 (+) Transcript_21528:153-2468(+)|eukprot:CAMPEP_0194199284 /NCGR_PEP_ID=MMETSP0156-20130528/360_1 /TAXON_ID=33649 /ORGANISM="Thalassionema nitzschioides, Strain L26-B" /LENGTH=771 /DNA_ID=CAMNT_0038924159 /DNA_START=108 /DNA_END=2423 /DNA_ORIENTATION=-
MTLMFLLGFQRKWNTTLIFMSLFFLSLATARRIPYATVFPGFGGNKGANKEENIRLQEKDGTLPPPPPPPDTRGGTSTDNTGQPGGSRSTENQRQEEYNTEEYPPQSQYWTGPFDPYANLPPPPPGWLGPPPQWNHQSGIVQQELDNSVARENYLLNEMHNLTATLSALQHREKLHLQQLDVLTERVMDAESDAATERNSLVEYRANCTKLESTVFTMTKEIDEITQKCQNLTAQHSEDQEKYEEMKVKLEERSKEVEELATVIEMARIEHDREQYLAERRKKKKQRGFFSWMFGFGEEDEGEEERLQEFARTTLLRALQTERESVHELETTLATLEQNNSAISEMVESRDMLIDELNNRVAVFEEDKLVLKAALRQLQKEMKDEAPRTQKLVDDLKDARKEVQSLNKMIDSILSDHQTELSLLQNVITQKQKTINDTESNMTVIGTYVDKLEERLATFAVAKRDIELRERKCVEIEERVLLKEEENAGLLKKIYEFEKDQEDLKLLLKDLVDERTQLQTQKTVMISERDNILAEGAKLRDAISSLETDVDGLNQLSSERKLQVDELELTAKRQSLDLEASLERESNLAHTLAEKIDELERERRLPSILENENTIESNRQGPPGTKETNVNSSENATEPAQPSINSTEHTMEPKQPFVNSTEPAIEPQNHLLPENQAQRESENAPPTFQPLDDDATVTQIAANKRKISFLLEDQAQLESKNTPSFGHHLNDETGVTQITANKRKVPFRNVRKTFAKVTGVHGAFTPPSKKP